MSEDARAIAELAGISDVTVPHTLRHYIYVPTREAAVHIAGELRRQGFRTEDRLGGDGVNWLVLACHEVVPSEQLVVSLRRSMETLIATVDGEYDGWEAEVHRLDGGSPSRH